VETTIIDDGLVGLILFRMASGGSRKRSFLYFVIIIVIAFPQHSRVEQQQLVL
jgi:hypothetical protein